jgi:chorismate mutase/prephenate dehydratase
MEKDISSLRNQIDDLDSKIIDAIQERAKIGKKIGELKLKSGEPIYRPDRERDVYEKVTRKSNGPLPKETMIAIYKEIMSGVISLEKHLRIGYLGPEGSFSHEALRSKFGSSVESHPISSIPDIFRSVESGSLDYGVVPVENSTEGLVSSTLDQFLVSDLRIYSEMYLRIVFHLLGFERDLKKVSKVYGIKIGNEQCRNFIQSNLSHAEIHETSSTAMAAKTVSERKDGVAIAGRIAGEIYQLDRLFENIQDLSVNATRFLVIGKDIAQPTGRDKTSLVFSVPDKPGSLFSVLNVFHRRNVNLTKIESRPSRRNLWEYNFFIDFLGHVQDTNVQEIMAELKPLCTLLKVLGSYPVSERNL